MRVADALTLVSAESKDFESGEEEEVETPYIGMNVSRQLRLTRMLDNLIIRILLALILGTVHSIYSRSSMQWYQGTRVEHDVLVSGRSGLTSWLSWENTSTLNRTWVKEVARVLSQMSSTWVLHDSVFVTVPRSLVDKLIARIHLCTTTESAD